MPASHDGCRPAGLVRALLASLCLLACGPALAFDGDLAVAPDDPLVSREIALVGFVREEEPVETALARAGLPAGLGPELKDALAGGDRFLVRYRQTVGSDGRPVGAARIVSGEVARSGRRTISFHRFRPARGAEQLWQANGESLAAPAMRLPLETISVSSAFGVRADPFEQPRNGLGAPSRLGAVGAALNTATARGIALGLAPGPGRSARRRGAAFVMHNGVDLLAPTGTPVLAAAAGTVVGAAPNAGYGNWIRIDHERKVATVYGHLSAFAPGIRAGVKVEPGQVIGFVGSTGRSTGPHLHFEVIADGRAIDPMSFPPTRRARLEGADLERFRRHVRQAEAAQHDGL